MRRGRVAGVVVTAALAWVGVLQTAAVAGDVDLSVTVYGDSADHAMGEVVPLYVQFGNSGTDSANDVTLTLQADNGTIGSIDTSWYDGTTCVSDGTATATCEIAAFASWDLQDLSVPVTADLPSDASASETVTLSASVSSPGDTDTDHSNNSSTGSFTAVRAPAVTISHKFLYDPQRANGDPVNPASTAVEVFLKDTSGHNVPDQVVEVYDRPAGSIDPWNDEGEAWPGTSDYAFLNPPVANVPLEFRLVHPATIDAGAAEETFIQTPRAVRITQSAPRLSTTYGGYPQFKGTLTFVDSGSPVASGGTITLQHRAPGSQTWSKVPNVDIDWMNGKFSTTISPKANGDYRWKYDGEYFGAGSAVGSPIAVTVHQSLLTSLSPVAIPPGGEATLTVAVKPGDAGKRVTLQRKVGSSWKVVGTHTLGAASTFAWHFRPTAVGRPTYRVVKAATTDLGAGASRGLVLSVTRSGRGSGSSYAFEGRYNGHPTSWNPCNTIDFKVNLAHAPKQALADVKEAVRRINLAGGLKFHFAGTTHEVPDDNPSDQHAELLIGWRAANSLVAFQLGAIGFGGYSSIYRSGHDTISRGFVVIDYQYRLHAGFGFGQTEGQLLMHELGHAVGLAHTNGKSQIMRPMLDDHLYAAMYGAGDINGLKKLGKSQGCF